MVYSDFKLPLICTGNIYRDIIVARIRHNEPFIVAKVPFIVARIERDSEFTTLLTDIAGN